MPTAPPTRRLRLGIDLDGVVADFNTGWVLRYNRDFGTDLHPDEVVVWDAPVLLTHFPSMREFWEWARTCGEGRSIFHVLDPYDGALDALRELRAAGHHLVVLTTKPEFSIHDTYEWLAWHAVPTTEVHILEDKTTVTCDVYLDDADHNLAALLAAHPHSTVCRFVRPWNRPQDGAVDVGGWDAFRTIVDGIAAR